MINLIKIFLAKAFYSWEKSVFVVEVISRYLEVIPAFTSTGSEVFSFSSLDVIKYLQLSFFSLIPTICLKIWAKTLPKNAESLPVDIRCCNAFAKAPYYWNTGLRSSWPINVVLGNFYSVMPFLIDQKTAERMGLPGVYTPCLKGGSTDTAQKIRLILFCETRII